MVFPRGEWKCVSVSRSSALRDFFDPERKWRNITAAP